MPLEWTTVSPWTAEVSPDVFLRELAALNLDDACEIYRIRHRSVFKTSLPPLGEVAVKEVRHLRLKQRFKLRRGGRSKAEQEFRNAQALFRKGLRTPIPYAIGLDRDWLGLHRVLQIYEWLPAAESLTECVHRGDCPWDEVSDFLWSCARAGLVHRGHSSENLMRCEGQWYVIDLADASVTDAGYQREGFARDVARIARKLLREKALCESGVEAFIQAVVERSEGDTALQSDIHRAMDQLVREGQSKALRKSPAS